MFMGEGSSTDGIDPSFCSPNLFARSVREFAFRFAVDRVSTKVKMPLTFYDVAAGEDLSQDEKENLSGDEKKHIEAEIASALKKCWSCVQELRAAYLRSSIVAAVDWSESKITLDSMFNLGSDAEDFHWRGEPIFGRTIHGYKETFNALLEGAKKAQAQRGGDVHSHVLRELSYLMNTPKEKGSCKSHKGNVRIFFSTRR